MNTIKFSHAYNKLQNKKGDGYLHQAILMEVLVIDDIKNMSRTFLDYDSAFNGGKYQYPHNGRYILLLFRSIGSNQCFTTLRPYTKEKFFYYFSKREQIFNIEYVCL